MFSPRGTRAQASTRRRTPRQQRNDTLILLDDPASGADPWDSTNLLSGPPPGTAGSGRAGRPDRRGPGFLARREALIAAVAIVAIVAGAATVVLRSHSTPASGSLPVLGGVPTFPQFSTQPSASPSAAPTRPATRRETGTHQKSGTGAPTQTSTTPAARATGPAIAVTYKIDQRWNGGFQAEIDVVNNGTQPISNWQIAVALESDQFTSWWNATGYVSNGILLLYQPSYDGPVAAYGGTLHVYFDVSGSQTTPNACGFDGIACS